MRQEDGEQRVVQPIEHFAHERAGADASAPPKVIYMYRYPVRALSEYLSPRNSISKLDLFWANSRLGDVALPNASPQRMLGLHG